MADELYISLGKLVRRLSEQTQPNNFTSKSVLLRLDRDGPANVLALARAESVRQQSMHSTVAALQALGALMGVANPVDGRQILITLTDTFRQRLATQLSEERLTAARHPGNAAVRRRTGAARRRGQVAAAACRLLTRY